jgi:hypothetical protein
LSSRVGAPGLWLEEMTTQLWTTDQGWCSSLWVRWEPTNLHHMARQHVPRSYARSRTNAGNDLAWRLN